MLGIDIDYIILNSNLKTSEVAAQLFPQNSHPGMALKRVSDGKALLNSEQLFKLSRLAGCTVSDLYSTDAWTEKAGWAGEKIFVFTKGDYVAKLNTENSRVTIQEKGTLIHTELLPCGFITIRNFTEKLETIINK